MPEEGLAAEEVLEVVEDLEEVLEAEVDLEAEDLQEVIIGQDMAEKVLIGQGHMGEGVLIVLVEEVLTGQVQDFAEGQGHLTGQEHMKEAVLMVTVQEHMKEAVLMVTVQEHMDIAVHVEGLSFQEGVIRINYFIASEAA